ncbi:hypothetical protein [Streptomyces hirsutus]|uniref:hypothetical protein n=1 Tax=Streptomyces hirsutus TaxID=35620 RepID=UPI0036B46D8B
MGTTTIAVFASTLIAAPAAQAADVTLKSRTWTKTMDGKVHAVYESYDDHVRPEDVSIRIRKKDSEQVLDTVRLIDTDQCAPDYHCWDMQFLSEPVTLPEMGVYTTDVVVREGRSDELVDRDNGQLSYGLNPHLTVTSNPQWISYDKPLIKVSGTLVAEDPNTHEVKPFAGAGVYYHNRPGYFEGRLRTNDAGRFTELLSFSEYSTDTQVEFSFGAARETLTLPFRKQELKLKVDAPLGTVNAPYGSDVPVGGKLTRIADDGTEKPLSGYDIVIGGQKTLVTRKDGTFSTGFTVKQGGTVKIVPSRSGWFNTPTHSFEVTQPLRRSKFSSLKASVDKYRKVTFTGKLGVTEGSYPAGTSAVIAIEHSTNGKTWSSVGTFTAKYGATFTKSPAKKGSAGSHWRLRHTGADLNSTSFKLGRKSTQLVNDDLTPEGVRKGKTLTAKGSLIQKSGSSWKSFSGQTVRIYFKASTKGATWKKLGTAKTLSNGTFSKKFTAKQDGTWQIRYIDTPSTHYADYGREDYVDVR